MSRANAHPATSRISHVASRVAGGSPVAAPMTPIRSMPATMSAANRSVMPNSVSGRPEDCILVGPALGEAAGNRCRRDSALSRPFSQAMSAPTRRQIDVVAPVAVLLCARRPTTVSRAVAKAVVASIQGESLGLGSHVGSEAGEVVPYRINADAPSAVSWVSIVGGAEASTAHLTPRLVERVIARGVRQPVRSGARRRDFNAKTPTGADLSLDEVPARRSRFVSALASAKPSSVTLDERSHHPQHREATKNHPGHVYRLRHSASYATYEAV